MQMLKQITVCRTKGHVQSGCAVSSLSSRHSSDSPNPAALGACMAAPDLMSSSLQPATEEQSASVAYGLVARMRPVRHCQRLTPVLHETHV